MNNQSLTFPQAIQATRSLINKIDQKKITETEIEQKVSAIVNTKNGARGFFVAYLTSDMPLADSPSIGVINGLKAHIQLVSELLVKNLAMSSAMTISHSRNNDLSNARGSHKVCQRTGNLIQNIDLNITKQELKKLQATILENKEDYKDFMERWDYDLEQQQAIVKTISGILL